MTLDERTLKFNEELEAIKLKYEFNIAAQPLFTPEGTVVARAVLVDAAKKEEPQALATP